MSTKETDVKKSKGLGFKADGSPYPGVSDKGERVTVTLQALKDEFGAEKGEEKYRAIGQVTQTLDIFGKLESYAPDIHIAGAPKEVQFKVNEILTAK
jgi:hypothetical protein